MTRSTQTILRRYGQEIQVQREGEELGRGWAILRPLLDRENQFVPTRLGLEEEEELLCLGEASLPLAGEGLPLEVIWQERTYRVVNARLLQAGGESLCWRAWLTKKGEKI